MKLTFFIQKYILEHTHFEYSIIVVTGKLNIPVTIVIINSVQIIFILKCMNIVKHILVKFDVPIIYCICFLILIRSLIFTIFTHFK